MHTLTKQIPYESKSVENYEILNALKLSKIFYFISKLHLFSRDLHLAAHVGTFYWEERADVQMILCR